MPDISEEFLSLRDPSCTLTTNSTHIMGTMSFSTCGTKLEVQNKTEQCPFLSAALQFFLFFYSDFSHENRIKATISSLRTRSTQSSGPTRSSSGGTRLRSTSSASFPKASASPTSTASTRLTTSSPSPTLAASATALRYSKTATSPAGWSPTPTRCRSS